MHIAIAGGSGLVGNALQNLWEDEHDITVLTRQPSMKKNGVRYVQWLSDRKQTIEELGSVDVFINLAGKSINDGRWSDDDKKAILESRLQASEELVSIIQEMDTKPKLVLQASAVGVYHTSETTRYTEQSDTSGDEFLQRVVHQWEAALKPLQSLNIRTAFTRFGVILSDQGGAFPLMTLPYKFGVGGKVGKGTQWISWIHLDDVVRGIDYIVQDDQLEGVFNFTAPFPIQMDAFGKLIGEALHRPHLFPVPAPLLKVVLGDKHILVTKGQYVEPARLLQTSFTFNYPTAKEAIDAILKKPS